MDSAAVIGISVVGIIYLLGLIVFLRKMLKGKKSGKPIDRRLMALSISSGIVLILLILSLILSRYR